MLRSRALLATVPLAFTLAAGSPHSGAPGITYTFTTRVQTTANGQPTEKTVMTAHAAVAGDRARIDFDSVAAAAPGATPSGLASQGYLLVLDGGRRMMLVDPAKRQYAEISTLPMLQGVAALFNGSNGLIRMRATDVHIDAQNMGAGPTIAGYPTVHYRLTQAMTLQTRVLFKTMNTRDSSVTDYYYAPTLKNFVNPFTSSSQGMMQSVDLFGPEYRAQMTAAQAKLYQGAALRTVTTAYRTNDKGQPQTSVTTTEVTNLRAGNVSDALFEIPAGYTEVKMSPAAGQQSAEAPDDRGSAGAAKSGQAADSATPSTQERVKKGIRGLFGKPE